MVWASFKKRWAKFIASFPLAINHDLIEEMLEFVLQGVAASLTPRILTATEPVMQLVRLGELV